MNQTSLSTTEINDFGAEEKKMWPYNRRIMESVQSHDMGSGGYNKIWATDFEQFVCIVHI